MLGYFPQPLWRRKSTCGQEFRDGTPWNLRKKKKEQSAIRKKAQENFWDRFYFGFSQWLEPLCLQNDHSTGNASLRLPRSLTSWILLLKIHVFTITDKWWCASHRNVLAFANLPTVAPNPWLTPSFLLHLENQTQSTIPGPLTSPSTPISISLLAR